MQAVIVQAVIVDYLNIIKVLTYPNHSAVTTINWIDYIIITGIIINTMLFYDTLDCFCFQQIYEFPIHKFA